LSLLDGDSSNVGVLQKHPKAAFIICRRMAGESSRRSRARGRALTTCFIRYGGQAMKAAVVKVLGEPPRYQDFADPKAEEVEVLINVQAAGLHPIVKALASGSHYAGKGEVPAVPGVDGVGKLEDGSRVYFTFARKPWGSMCERTVAPRAKCLALPDNIDEVQAAAIANPGMSALLSDTRSGRTGEGRIGPDPRCNRCGRTVGDPGRPASWRQTHCGCRAQSRRTGIGKLRRRNFAGANRRCNSR
jgi:hypothetical protein